VEDATESHRIGFCDGLVCVGIGNETPGTCMHGYARRAGFLINAFVARPIGSASAGSILKTRGARERIAGRIVCTHGYAQSCVVFLFLSSPALGVLVALFFV